VFGRRARLGNAVPLRAKHAFRAGGGSIVGRSGLV